MNIYNKNIISKVLNNNRHYFKKLNIIKLFQIKIDVDKNIFVSLLQTARHLMKLNEIQNLYISDSRKHLT